MKDGDVPAGLPFRKMHGLGNDFVVIDARGRADPMTPARARAIGDRRRGLGFDQLVVMRDAADADVEVVFWNADGTTAGACGNASRCIARLVMEETGRDAVTLRSARGLLACRRAGALYEVNMGPPLLGWAEVPLAREMDTAALDLPGRPGAVGMGNPHCVFFVDDAEAAPVATDGPRWEHDPLFPERANISFAEIRGPDRIRLRVWERGAGETLACGSAACAALVAAHRRGLTGRRAEIALNGGALTVEWAEAGVLMTGPATLVGTGALAPEFLAAAG